MVFVNKKLTERTETLPSGTTTYTSPSGQEVISPPANSSPTVEHKYVGSYRNPGVTYRNPGVTSPCNNCKSVSPPVKNETSTGLTTDDYILIGIGILVVIVVIGLMVI